jgi:hypothetical protein
MKSALLLFFVFVVTTVCVFSQSQCGYYGTFYPEPATSYQLQCSNNYLAHKYAPMLTHFVNISLPQSENGKADVPTKVDYDGDWNHLNNWENIGDVDVTEAALYYAVAWTENLWIITYTVYHPRDFGKVFGDETTYNACLKLDWHEGDSEKIVIVINRESGRIMGYSTNHHSSNDQVTCVDYENETAMLIVEDNNTNPIYDIGQYINLVQMLGMMADLTPASLEKTKCSCSSLVLRNQRLVRILSLHTMK